MMEQSALFPVPEKPQRVPKAPKPPVVYTALDDDDRMIIRALGGCTFLPGSSEKRFARNIQHAKQITERQREFLNKLRWKFRRQISDRVPFRYIPS